MMTKHSISLAKSCLIISILFLFAAHQLQAEGQTEFSARPEAFNETRTFFELGLLTDISQANYLRISIGDLRIFIEESDGQDFLNMSPKDTVTSIGTMIFIIEMLLPMAIGVTGENEEAVLRTWSTSDKPDERKAARNVAMLRRIKDTWDWSVNWLY